MACAGSAKIAKAALFVPFVTSVANTIRSTPSSDTQHLTVPGIYENMAC